MFLNGFYSVRIISSIVLLVFYLIAVIGMKMFSGNFLRRCMNLDNGYFYAFSNATTICSQTSDCSYLNSFDSLYVCEKSTINPNYNLMNFDNIFQCILTVFQIATGQNLSNLYSYLHKGFFSDIFIAVILKDIFYLGSTIMLNLVIFFYVAILKNLISVHEKELLGLNKLNLSEMILTQSTGVIQQTKNLAKNFKKKSLESIPKNYKSCKHNISINSLSAKDRYNLIKEITNFGKGIKDIDEDDIDENGHTNLSKKTKEESTVEYFEDNLQLERNKFFDEHKDVLLSYYTNIKNKNLEENTTIFEQNVIKTKSSHQNLNISNDTIIESDESESSNENDMLISEDKLERAENMYNNKYNKCDFNSNNKQKGIISNMNKSPEKSVKFKEFNKEHIIPRNVKSLKNLKKLSLKRIKLNEDISLSKLDSLNEITKFNEDYQEEYDVEYFDGAEGVIKTNKIIDKDNVDKNNVLEKNKYNLNSNFNNYGKLKRSNSISIKKFNWDILTINKKGGNRTMLRDENISDHTLNYYKYLNNLLNSKIKIKSNFNLMKITENKLIFENNIEKDLDTDTKLIVQKDQMQETFKFEYYNPLNIVKEDIIVERKLMYLKKRNIIEKIEKNKLSGESGIMNEPPELIKKMSSNMLFKEIIKESKIFN